MRKTIAPVAATFLLTLSVPPLATAADNYAFVEGQVFWSFDRSNHDEVEFGNEPGGGIAVGYGHRHYLDNHWSIDAEGQIIGQVIPLHGRNDKREATADGRNFWLAGLTINAWPAYALDDQWSLYAGGGVGPAVITAFGSSSFTGLVIGGGGVRYAMTDALTLDVGGRYYWTVPVRVNGAKSEYDSFGPSFRAIWNF